MLELKLTAPMSIQPTRVNVGQRIPVRAKVLADNVDLCEVSLIIDEIVIEEVSGQPNPITFAGPTIAGQVQWELRAKGPTVRSFVAIEGRANGLMQRSEFALEVSE